MVAVMLEVGVVNVPDAVTRPLPFVQLVKLYWFGWVSHPVKVCLALMLWVVQACQVKVRQPRSLTVYGVPSMVMIWVLLSKLVAPL